MRAQGGLEGRSGMLSRLRLPFRRFPQYALVGVQVAVTGPMAEDMPRIVADPPRIVADTGQAQWRALG